MTLNKFLQELVKYQDKKAEMYADYSKAEADRNRYAEEQFDKGIARNKRRF